MRVQDVLELELETIPDCHLARLRPTEQAADRSDTTFTGALFLLVAACTNRQQILS